MRQVAEPGSLRVMLPGRAPRFLKARPRRAFLALLAERAPFGFAESLPLFLPQQYGARRTIGTHSGLLHQVW